MNTAKRMICLLLTVALMLGLMPTVIAAQPSFIDVPAGMYYSEPVAWAVENGITNGTGANTFSPDAICSRGQVVTFLWRAQGSPEPISTVNQFTDAVPGSYYYKAMLWAVEQGITTGTGNGAFSPDMSCNRDQVVTFLWRAQGKPAPTNTNNPFKDVTPGSYYYDAVLWAVENGITTGTGKDTFSPGMSCSRGQIVTFLQRAIEPADPADPPVEEHLRIVTQPQSATIEEDESAILRVVVTGGVAPYTYQWKKNGSNIVGANSDSYTASVAGSYTCTVTDAEANIITTSQATITIRKQTPLVITQQPQSATIEEDESAILRVVVTGGVAPYTYQWKKNGSDIVGANSDSYTASVAGNYTCTISDANGNSVITSEAIITIRTQAPLVIVQQPQSATIELGNKATLYISATGGVAPYHYQWMVDGNEIAGATAATYIAEAAGNYSCKVGDSKNSYNVSTIAVITVNVPSGGPLTITRQPLGGEITKGLALNLSVGVDGGVKPYSYQWYLDGTAISGATFRTYVATEGGKYFCAIYDSTGDSVITSAAVVTAESERFDIHYDLYGNDTYLRKVGVSNPNPNSYDSEQGLNLINLSAKGYKFDGWFDGMGANATRVKKIDKDESGDKYLYAHWIPEEYTVQFKSSLYIEESETTYTVNKGVVLPTPKLSNYVFAGWSDDNGNVYANATIPVGTTGDLTLTANWTSERNKTWTKPVLDDPIIHIDEEEGVILFAYEIGEIQNVPLYTIKDFGYIAGDGITKTETTTYEMVIREEYMEAYTEAVANATTRSSDWTLSSDWSETTSVDEEWCAEKGYTVDEAITRGKSDTGTWNVSNSESGSTETTDLSSNEEGWQNSVKINSSTERTDESKIAAGVKSSIGADAYGIKAEISAELNTEVSASETRKNGVETGGASTGTELSTKSTTSSSGWNSESSYGGSSTNSEEVTISNELSEKICQTYGYGKEYIMSNGSETSQGLSSTSSSSNEYSSSVTFGTETKTGITSTWTTQATKAGYHRWVVAGTAHVFGVVGYNMATQSYFVYTYSVMDDKTFEFEDYSYTTAKYNDEQNGVISFEVPYEVADYVADLTAHSSGLRVDIETGIVQEYIGSDNCVVIPEYYCDEQGEVVKITGISSTAFKGKQEDSNIDVQTSIRTVVLSDNITVIPSNTFSGCTSLVGITGGSITSVGDSAFNGCTSLVDCGIHSNVEFLGKNAFAGVKKLQVNAGNASIVQAAVNSGAKEIVLYLNSIEDTATSLSGVTLEVPSGTASFEFNSYGPSLKDNPIRNFNDLTIISHADKTVINKASFVSSGSIPLRIHSPEVVLNQVSVSANGIAMVLAAENSRISLQGTNNVSSKNNNALLCKNLSLFELSSSFVGKLIVNGTMLVCGKVAENALLTCTNIETISIETFNNMLNSFTLFFDPNGGTCDTASCEIPNGTAIGQMPIPKKQYYTFTGWYRADGAEVTASSVFFTGLDFTVYAKWVPNTFILKFDANGGECATSSTTMTYGNAIGSLPIPTRDYYIFDGWYTSTNGGTKVTVDTVFDGDTDVVIYAHWTQNSTSDWVLASSAPADAQITDRKWTYTLTSYKTSSSSKLSGWTQYDAEYKWGSWGSWSKWQDSSVSKNDSRQVETRTGYHYYYYVCSNCGAHMHGYGTCYTWAGGCGKNTVSSGSYHSVRSAITYSNASDFHGTGAYYTDYTDDGRAFAYISPNSSYYVAPITQYRYRTRDQIWTYYFYKTEEKESSSKPSGSDISNIKEWVKYRPK